jgi:hypothetical protein
MMIIIVITHYFLSHKEIRHRIWKKNEMRGFSLSERCSWNYCYPGMWRCVFGLAVPNFSRDRSASHYDPPKRRELLLCILHEEVYGSEGLAPVILRLISPTPQQPYVREKWRRYDWNSRLGVLQECSSRFEEPLTPAGNRTATPQLSMPQPSHYTNCATPTQL